MKGAVGGAWPALPSAQTTAVAGVQRGVRASSPSGRGGGQEEPGDWPLLVCLPGDWPERPWGWGGGEIGHALGAPPPPSGRHDGFRPSAGKGPWWSGCNPRQIQRTGRLWPFASSLLLKMSHFDNKAIKHRSDWLPNVHMGWVGIADSTLLPLFPVNNSCTSVRFHRSYHVGTSHFTAIWVNCERKPPPPMAVCNCFSSIQPVVILWNNAFLRLDFSDKALYCKNSLEASLPYTHPAGGLKNLGMDNFQSLTCLILSHFLRPWLKWSFFSPYIAHPCSSRARS